MRSLEFWDVDLICYKVAEFPGESKWFFSDETFRPNNQRERKFYGITAHEERNWIEIDMMRAENICRVYAYKSDDGMWGAFAVGYCEQRLTDHDIECIARLVRVWDDIPF